MNPPLEAPVKNRRVLLIGWDAADWKMIHPLLDAGKLPALKGLIEGGVMGNLATLNPMYSPMLWTSIATGKRPYKHGVHGFSEVDPVSGGVRPISGASRHCKAIWNMLSQEGKRSMVIGWWPSHPAEPINGVMVSNHYQRASGKTIADWPMAPGTVHPAELGEVLQQLRMHPADVGAGHLLPFVPAGASIDQDKDRRLQSLAKIVADSANIQAAATFLMRQEPWDFMAVYFDAIDHFGHGFMKYHPPRQGHVSEADFQLYQGVLETGYRFHDMMLSALLRLVGDDVTVVLISDHGFHPDNLRPTALPAEPAGPAHEHRPYGIFVAKGPGIKRDQPVFGASLLDICPTLLTLFGLPVGEDMDGRVLEDLFEGELELATIPSWEAREGAAGMHGDADALDPAAMRAGMDQLVALGYVEAPTGDRSQQAIATNRELDYNLAKALMDGGHFADALGILDGLQAASPDDFRFHLARIDCLAALGKPAAAAQVADDLIVLRERVAERTREPLARLIRRVNRLRQVLKVSARRPERHRRFQQRMRQARAQFRHLAPLARIPKEGMAQLKIRAAAMAGDFDKALELTGEMGEKAQNRTDYHLIRAGLLNRKQAVDEAIAAYQRALEIDPECRTAWAGLARALVRKKDWAGAEEAARRATGLFFHNPQAHYLIGAACQFQGRPADACVALAHAVKQAPGFIRAFRLLARITRQHHPDPLFHAVFRSRAERLVFLAKARNGGVAQVSDFDRSRLTPFPVATGTAEANEVITIVTGLPRSGTSLMMQMLAAGGLVPLTDEARQADESNPRGYLEYRPVMSIARDASWMAEARGKVVKIVAPLLVFLPEQDADGRPFHYRIVFMNRDWREIHASQSRMIQRRGEAGASRSVTGLKHAFEQQLQRVRSRIVQQNIAALDIDYAEAIANPAGIAARLAAFLPGFDAAAAALTVAPALHHERVPGID